MDYQFILCFKNNDNQDIDFFKKKIHDVKKNRVL